MTSKPSDTLRQDLTAALEAAGKSLLETAELFKRVSSLEITPAVEEPKVNTRRKKDPNAPKRPPGSFFLFANDRRPKLRDEQPETSTKDIARLLGEEWKVLGEKTKKAYIQKADVQKERYHKEVEAYKSKKPAKADEEEEEEEEVDELEEKAEEKPKEEAAPKPKKKAKAQPKPKAEVAAPAPAEKEAEPKKKRGRQAAPKETKETKTESKETSSKKAKTKKSA